MKKYDIKNKITIKKATKENNFNGYYEVPYTEYREDGSILCTGTEDFSGERLKTLKTYEILEKTGEKTKASNINLSGRNRNRWGHITYITVAKRSDAVKISKIEYPDKELQIRNL